MGHVSRTGGGRRHDGRGGKVTGGRQIMRIMGVTQVVSSIKSSV